MGRRVLVWIATLPDKVKARGCRRGSDGEPLGQDFIRIADHAWSDRMRERMRELVCTDDEHMARIEQMSHGAVLCLAEVRVDDDAAYHHLLRLDENERLQYNMWRSCIPENLEGKLFRFQILRVHGLVEPRVLQQSGDTRFHGLTVELEHGQPARLWADLQNPIPGWLQTAVPPSVGIRAPSPHAHCVASGSWQALWLPNITSALFSVSWPRVGRQSSPPVPGFLSDEVLPLTPSFAGLAADAVRGWASVSLAGESDHARAERQAHCYSLVTTLQSWHDGCNPSGLISNIQVRW